MKLSIALEFNEKYLTFDLRSLNNIEIAAEVYDIFYKSKEIEEIEKKEGKSKNVLRFKIERLLERYPEERQRYTALSRMVIEAKQICEKFKLKNILEEIKKTKIDKIILKYIGAYFENYVLTFNHLSSRQMILNLIETNEGNNKSPMNEQELNEFKQKILSIISEVNVYIETNFEI